MKHKFILIVLILLVIPIACADLIPMGKKHVNYCIQVSNIADYPDYVFAYYGDLVSGFNIVTDECFSFYKFDRPRIYAFEADAFEEFKEYVDYENPYTFDHSLAREFFENLRPGVYASDISFRAHGLVSQYDPLKSIEDVVEIKSISNGVLDIDKKEAIFEYEDGKKAVKQYTSDEMPSAPKRLFLPFNMWLLLIPIFSAIIIFIMLMRRKK